MRAFVRLGSALSVLDVVHFGSCLSLRSCGRLGSQLSFFAQARFGSSIAVLDFLMLGSTISLRSYVHLGSMMSVFGCSKFGSAVAVLDFLQLDLVLLDGSDDASCDENQPEPQAVERRAVLLPMRAFAPRHMIAATSGLPTARWSTGLHSK